MKLFTLYIGCPDASRVVLEILQDRFDSFTMLNALGAYRGQVEASLLVQIASDDGEAIIAAAQEVRARLKQVGVGIAYQSRYHRCRADDDAQSLRDQLADEARQSHRSGQEKA